jgi:hypothetical protein
MPIQLPKPFISTVYQGTPLASALHYDKDGNLTEINRYEYGRDGVLATISYLFADIKGGNLTLRYKVERLYGKDNIYTGSVLRSWDAHGNLINVKEFDGNGGMIADTNHGHGGQYRNLAFTSKSLGNDMRFLFATHIDGGGDWARVAPQAAGGPSAMDRVNVRLDHFTSALASAERAINNTGYSPSQQGGVSISPEIVIFARSS